MAERRQSPAVYRRRRQVVAVLALVVLGLLIWGIVAVVGMFADEDTPEQEPTAAASGSPDGGGDESEESSAEEPDDDADSSPSPSPSASPSPTEEEVEEGYCAPSDIEISASTNREEYGISDAPMLIMEIENTSDEECTLNVGTSQQRFTVTHNDRQIFSITQCDLSTEDLEMDFDAGQTETAQFVWPRSDSAEDCNEPAELRAGEYELTVALSDMVSEPVSFTLAGIEET